MTVPNALTLLRILLTPFLVWLLIHGRMTPALIVFFISGVTDGLDGLIARVFNQKSTLGAYLDPLADKLLLVSSFIMLGRMSLVPDWLAVIVVSRDGIIIIGLLTLMFHQVPVEIKPSILSKATTLVELVTILSRLGHTYVVLPAWGYRILFVSTAVLCIASGVHYMSIGLSLLDGHRNRNNNGRQ